MNGKLLIGRKIHLAPSDVIGSQNSKIDFDKIGTTLLKLNLIIKDFNFKHNNRDERILLTFHTHGKPHYLDI